MDLLHIERMVAFRKMERLSLGDEVLKDVTKGCGDRKKENLN